MASLLYCHKTGCSHEKCRRAWNAYGQHRVRQMAYGRWQPYVDAGPAREHVQWLISQGVPVTNLSPIYSGVNLLLYGAPHRGMPPTQRMRRESAEALLAVRPTLDMLGPGAYIDSAGARRRLQGLCALGWSVAAIARHMETAPRQIHRALDEATVTAAMHQRVLAAYEDLSMVRPEGLYADKTRRRAARQGWVPPLAWDEEFLDLPEQELEEELSRRVALMEPSELHRAEQAVREGERSPLIVAAAAAGRDHRLAARRARRAAKKAALAA